MWEKNGGKGRRPLKLLLSHGPREKRHCKRERGVDQCLVEFELEEEKRI